MSAESIGKIRVLFICTGNSCRSQMAQAWARHYKGQLVDPYSAGVEPRGLDLRAFRVMAEAGVDLSKHRSKHTDEFAGVPMDAVVTLSEEARKYYTVFQGATMLHKPFDDPPRLAAGAKTEEEALDHYRRVRDQIREFVLTLPGALQVFRASKNSQQMPGPPPPTGPDPTRQ